VAATSAERLRFALNNLQVGDWERFEKIASAFMAADFPNMRTMANPSGDGGRDGELFETSKITVVVQISISKDWKTKIEKTAKRLKTTSPNAAILVYVTNQVIGANGDEIKKDLFRDYSLFLDIRDQNWFLERLGSSSVTELAASELSRLIVDPILADKKIIESLPTALSDPEKRAALLYLELQWQDDERGKGLTKTAFEALVRSVLRNTTPEAAMTRQEVYAAVRSVLSSLDEKEVDQHTERALIKLTTKQDKTRIIKHTPQTDKFHTSFEEKSRLNAHLIEADLQEKKLNTELTDLVVNLGKNDDGTVPASLDVDKMVDCSRRVLEAFLLSRGESFSAALKNGNPSNMDFQGVRDLAIQDFSKRKEKNGNVDLVERVVKEIAYRPGIATRQHLRKLLDAYTILSLLRVTPDVQGVVKKMIGHGAVWLDTNIVLSLLTEQLVEEEERPYTKLLKISHAAGLKLHVTDGVLEELEQQIGKAKAYARHSGSWQGKTPYLYSFYAERGLNTMSFSNWLEDIAGSERVREDVIDYLNDFFNIEFSSLEADVDSTKDALRIAVQEYWISVHEERRREDGLVDDMLIRRLAQHDAENYLGVIVRRGSDNNPLGFSAWWLTLDRAAWLLPERIKATYSGPLPLSPVMSPDFLAGFLTFGPIRERVQRGEEFELPLTLGQDLSDVMPQELIDLAEKIRVESAGMPDRIIRRNIRDKIDRARRRRGDLANGAQ
jgi:hypothetical protein